MVKQCLKFLTLLPGVLALVFWGKPAWAVDQNFYFFIFKMGSQNTAQTPALIGKADQYLKTIADDHGNRKQDRLVNPIAVSFDLYRVDDAFATGFGLEINRYTKTYSFEDNSKIELETQGFLYGLSTYYRGNFWFPYFALGSGGYSVKIREKLLNTDQGEETTHASFIASAPNVLYYELGIRVPLGDWGVMTSWRATAARLKVKTVGKKLELGGQTTFLGAYYAF